MCKYSGLSEIRKALTPLDPKSHLFLQVVSLCYRNPARLNVKPVYQS